MLGDGSGSSGDSTSGMDTFSEVSGMLAYTPVNQDTKTVWKKVVVVSYYYILLQIR